MGRPQTWAAVQPRYQAQSACELQRPARGWQRLAAHASQPPQSAAVPHAPGLAAQVWVAPHASQAAHSASRLQAPGRETQRRVAEQVCQLPQAASPLQPVQIPPWQVRPASQSALAAHSPGGASCQPAARSAPRAKAPSARIARTAPPGRR